MSPDISQADLTMWGQTLFSMAVATYLLLQNTKALKEISVTLAEIMLLIKEKGEK